MDSCRWKLQTGFVCMGWWNDLPLFQIRSRKGRKSGRSDLHSKPFLYTGDAGRSSPCYKVPNVRVTIELPDGQPPWSPENSDGKYGGILTLKQGLAESVNTISAYLWTIRSTGFDRKSHTRWVSHLPAVPSICLGTADVSVYEMVGLIPHFTNKGVWTEPTYLTRIEDKKWKRVTGICSEKIGSHQRRNRLPYLNLMQVWYNLEQALVLRGQYKFSNPIAGKNRNYAKSEWRLVHGNHTGTRFWLLGWSWR